MRRTVFGITKSGRQMSLYTIANKNGMQITVSDFGAVVKNVVVPDKHGNPIDVVLGYESLSDYLKNTKTYFGATIGRNANRIAGASFSLNGKTYRLNTNENGSSLHSGPNGYHIRPWETEAFSEVQNAVTFTLSSPDGDQGFPGLLNISVTYMLSDDNEIHIIYEGCSDAATVFNPTNHSYFNLNGHAGGSVLNHVLTINADYYTPVCRGSLIPTGEIADVTGTPMDFRIGKAIGKDIDAEFEQLHIAGGYDHNYVLNNAGGNIINAATAVCENSGITMETDTDRPGIQFYTGNFLDNIPGKGKSLYGKRCGFCLETQYFPNSANEPAFKSPFIKAGEICMTETVYRFKSRGLGND